MSAKVSVGVGVGVRVRVRVRVRVSILKNLLGGKNLSSLFRYYSCVTNAQAKYTESAWVAGARLEAVSRLLQQTKRSGVSRKESRCGRQGSRGRVLVTRSSCV